MPSITFEIDGQMIIFFITPHSGVRQWPTLMPSLCLQMHQKILENHALMLLSSLLLSLVLFLLKGIEEFVAKYNKG